MPRGGAARVRFEGSGRATLELESGIDGLILYGWEGSVISDESPELVVNDAHQAARVWTTDGARKGTVK